MVANMDFKLKGMSNISKDKIVEDIIRVDKIVNKKILTKKEYCKYSKISGNTVNNYFISWHEALTAAGLQNKSNHRVPTLKLKKQGGKFLSNDDILKELKNTAKKIGKETITMKELDENSSLISGSTVSGRFGWKKGLELAGLKITPLGKRYSDEECFNNLLNIWSYYRRQPTTEEMKKSPSLAGPKAYTKRWGSWTKALESFVEEVNKTSGETKEIKPTIFIEKNQKTTVKIEDKRDIPIGLRYKVLSRDNFKCVICGDHPASDPKCKLHIDHIEPFSKGGKTKIENLRTLCNRCNIGKSDNQE